MVVRTTDEPWQDFGLVDRAWALASEVHHDDLRKGTRIPYVSHLWSVAALVLEHGGDDVQVAAALLHDAVEDGGGRTMLDRIRREVGAGDAQQGRDVADLVEALSDSVVDTTPGAVKDDWTTRKQRYLRHLADEAERVLLISACDKLHNARCTLADHRAIGSELWQRFNIKDPVAQAWYYDSLVRAFAGRVPEALEDELHRTVGALLERIEEYDEIPDLDDRLAARRADATQPGD